MTPLIEGVDSPVVDGSGTRAVVDRSLGSSVERKNVFEAAITAAVGKSRKLTPEEMEQAIKAIGFEPQVTWVSTAG